MDDLLKLDFLKLATPILTGITYFSAFKNGKPTCDRFMVNNFLYLLVSLMIYITAIKVYEEKNITFGNNEAGVKFGLVILCIIFLVSISYVDNQLIKHLFGILFIILLAYIVKGQIEKYDKELIKDTILKVTIIVLACVLILYLIQYSFMIMFYVRCLFAFHPFMMKNQTICLIGISNL